MTSSNDGDWVSLADADAGLSNQRPLTSSEASYCLSVLFSWSLNDSSSSSDDLMGETSICGSPTRPFDDDDDDGTSCLLRQLGSFLGASLSVGLLDPFDNDGFGLPLGFFKAFSAKDKVMVPRLP